MDEEFRLTLWKLLDQRRVKLPALAQATHYSRGYVWEIATGKKQPNVTIAKAFDAALKSDGVLTRCIERGAPSSTPPGPGYRDSVDATSTGREGEGPMRRRNLLTAAAAGLLPASGSNLDSLLLVDSAPTSPTDVTELASRLARVRAAFDACRYDRVHAVLPEVVATAYAGRRHAAGRLREQHARLLSAAYRLASELCVKLDDDGLAWVLADRALDVARETGDPSSIAAATRSVAIAMRRAGHHAGAVRVLTVGAAGLDAERGSADTAAVAAYGTLLCTAAYSSAQAGDRHTATSLIDEADAAAARLAGPIPELSISPTNVTVYRIGICTALGDSGAGLSYARSVDPTLLPTRERHARYCVDTARAWHLHGDPSRAYRALLAAEAYAPQEVRRQSVRALVSTLLYAPTPTPRGLREFAARLGVTG